MIAIFAATVCAMIMQFSLKGRGDIPEYLYAGSMGLRLVVFPYGEFPRGWYTQIPTVSYHYFKIESNTLGHSACGAILANKVRKSRLSLPSYCNMLVFKIVYFWFRLPFV